MSAPARWADMARRCGRGVLRWAAHGLAAVGATLFGLAFAISARAQSPDVQGIPTPPQAVELRSVQVARGRAHTCHIQPHAPSTDYLFVGCDNGSGTYCYGTNQYDIIPEAVGTPGVLERVIVCSNLGNGLQLLGVATQAWELLGARLYATAGDTFNPLVVDTIVAGPGDPRARALRVRIPSAAGESRLELLAVRDGALTPLFSYDGRRVRGGVPTQTTVEQGRIAGALFLVSTTGGASGRRAYRVARWNTAARRYDVSAECPNAQVFHEVLGWSSDGRHASLLRTPALRLNAEEQREGWSARYETTWLGWTTSRSGCAAAILRTRTVAYRENGNDERAVRYQIVDVDPRSGRLRLTEREVAASDPRIVAALGIGGACGRVADCCAAVEPVNGTDTAFLWNDCNQARARPADAEARCAAEVDGYAARLRNAGRVVPLACLPPPPQGGATASLVSAAAAPMTPVQLTPLVDAAIPTSVRTYAPGCSLDVSHGFAISQPGAPIDGTGIVPVFCSVGLQSTTRFVQFRGSEIVHVLGDHVADNWQDPSIDAVALVDVNADGSADFIALVRAVPGVGENHSDEFTVGDFWLGTSTGDWRRDQPARRLVEGAVTTAAAIERLRAHYASRVPTSPAPASTGGSFGGRNFGVPAPSTQGSD